MKLDKFDDVREKKFDGRKGFWFKLPFTFIGETKEFDQWLVALRTVRRQNPRFFGRLLYQLLVVDSK